MNDVDAQRWDEVADGWARYAVHTARYKEPVTVALLAGLALQPGDRVLELGAGPGELALRLADLVGSDGAVVATDVAPAMVDAAAEAVAGHPQVSTAVADAADLTMFDADFDAVVSRMGLMFVVDPLVALQEIHRVLRPGGRVAVAVWGEAEQNPWLVTVGIAARMAGLPVAPPLGPGGPFSLGDPDLLGRLAKEAGFDDATVAEVDIVFGYANADQHVEISGSLAPGLGPCLAAASAEQLDALHATVAAADAPYDVGGAIEVPGRALVLTAHRPVNVNRC